MSKNENIKVLCVIDVQNDFVSGSLGNETAVNKIPNIVEKINSENWDYIFLTMDTHEKNYLETKEGQFLPVEHCIEDTEGQQICSEVISAVDKFLAEHPEKTPNVFLCPKPTFGSISMVSQLAKVYAENTDVEFDITMVGFCTDICVISNALLMKAALYDRTNFYVVENCCGGVTEESHNAALTVMRNCQINII